MLEIKGCEGLYSISSFLSKQIKRNRKAYGLTWRYKEEI